MKSTSFDWILYRTQKETQEFALFEVYDKFAHVAKHKETDHYQIWQSKVADMTISSTITRTECHVFPTTEKAWDSKLEDLSLDIPDHAEADDGEDGDDNEI